MNDFPNKCFGCKRVDVPLNGFDYYIRINKKDHLRQRLIVTTTKLTFPMCDICDAKFKKKPKLLKNYLTIHKDGTYSINDPEYAKEVNDLIKQRIDEEVKEELFGIDEENAIYCPKCGKQAKKGIDFCKVCGKDLRVVL